MTTAVAGFPAVGILVLFTGQPAGCVEVATVLVLFTAVYVPGVFGARRLLATYARESAADFAPPHRTI